MTRPALVAALATVLLLAGCTGARVSSPEPSPSVPSSSSGSPSPGAAPSTPAVLPAAPKRAACYRLSTTQLTKPTNASTPVPCGSRHTAQTIYVGTLDTVVDGHAVAVDSATVQRQLSTTCPSRLAAYVGGSTTARDLSRFNVVWYSPTLAQSDAGADWFRCDLIAFAGEDQLAQLPGTRKLRGVLGRSGALADYGLCGTAAPGEQGFERVICSRGHSWKAIDTIGLAGGERYPGPSQVRRAGDGSCKDLAQSRAGDTLKFRYGWEWPTKEQWDRGQRFGYCWIPG
ncbi:MAG: septum formation family protein [Nocardioidaceae bacterium]